MFYPQIKASFGFKVESPNAFLQNCLEEDVTNAIETLSLQGGSINPEHYYTYLNNKIEYLCYTNENYERCVMQQPMLKEHVESEIKNSIKNKVDECLDEMKKAFESQGYEIVLRKGDFDVELLPKRIALSFSSSVSLKKGEEIRNYQSLSFSIKKNIYELISIANSILNSEAAYGDAEITTYMNYYPDLKVEKKKQNDGTTIYILTDKNTQDKFQFASRSIVWPPGYF